MAKVLYIHANIKPAGTSRSQQVAEEFLNHYRTLNPEDEIIELDLYKEDIDFLRPTDLMVTAREFDETARSATHLRYADQFAKADKYIIATPMWNLSIPAIVKAYFDYVTAAGITFNYTAQGPVGLLNNKKAVHIVARGGFYSEAPTADFEMGDRYVKTLLGFLGVHDYTTIAIDGLDAGGDSQKIVADVVATLPTIVKTF
ncbi:MAG: NAD(P)H-dependent oxidoreductase [Culicoidibacterales bacterium]